VSKNPVVPAKFKAAWQLLEDDPTQTMQSAAAAVGLNTRQLRGALSAPHVKRWILNQRRELLESINAGNPAALRHLRDTSENPMAAVNAIKTLEALKEVIDPSSARAGTVQHAPGLIVQIVTSSGEPLRTVGAPAPPLMLDDAAPLPVEIERDFD
jgi:hypothetical protein